MSSGRLVGPGDRVAVGGRRDGCSPGHRRHEERSQWASRGHEVVDEPASRTGDLVIQAFGYRASHDGPLEDARGAARARHVSPVGTATQIGAEEPAREGYQPGFEMVVATDADCSFADDLRRMPLGNPAAKFALVADAAVLLNSIGAAPRTTPRAPPTPLKRPTGPTPPAVQDMSPPPMDPDAEEPSNG